MVELALATPILVLLLMAGVDMGRLFYTTITANCAARAGVQYGAQSLITASDDIGMQNAAAQDAQDISGMTVKSQHYCQCQDGTNVQCGDGFCAGQQIVFVQVDTNLTFKPMTKVPGISSAVAVNGTAIRRVQAR